MQVTYGTYYCCSQTSPRFCTHIRHLRNRMIIQPVSAKKSIQFLPLRGCKVPTIELLVHSTWTRQTARCGATFTLQLYVVACVGSQGTWRWGYRTSRLLDLVVTVYRVGFCTVERHNFIVSCIIWSSNFSSYRTLKIFLFQNTLLLWFHIFTSSRLHSNTYSTGFSTPTYFQLQSNSCSISANVRQLYVGSVKRFHQEKG